MDPPHGSSSLMHLLQSFADPRLSQVVGVCCNENLVNSEMKTTEEVSLEEQYKRDDLTGNANDEETVDSCNSTAEENSARSFSSFDNIEKQSLCSDQSYSYEQESPGIIEQSMREYCEDKSVQMFKPTIGMTFDSCEEAYKFYNMYSWVQGFSIRHGDNYINKKGLCTMQEFKCQRSGISKGAKLSTTRCGCKAMLRILKTDNSKWYVKVFVEDHNHVFVESCGEKKHLFSHNHISKETKELIRHLRENNVSLSRVNCILGSFYGSMKKVPFSKKALRTVCSEIASDALQDDIRKTMESFREMISKDDKFVFTAQLDEEDRLKSLMWTSGRSRSLYKFFGEVITFDTTYETNIYKMPFGMFVGVNNHFESVIFAGVLLTNEKAENFKWAFEEFVSMMGGKAPITMLTDQCQAMGIAIRESLPGTTHRWCKWHVLRRAQEVLGHVYKEHYTFSDDFNKVVNHMLTVDEFESAWQVLIEKYNLIDNPFMTRAYECRQKWAKPYFKNIFCARMTSTQRSESANHVLKVYVPANSSLNTFVKQYTKLIDDREGADDLSEKNTNQRSIILSLGYPIEKHAAEIYTKNVYKLFKEELKKSTSYIIVDDQSTGIYKVKHVRAETREAWSRVEYTIVVAKENGFHKCECGLYEHFGVICSHVIRVMIHRGICFIPDCHIMKRWTRKARDGILLDLQGNVIVQEAAISRSLRHKMLYMSVQELVNLGEIDQQTFDISMKNIERWKKEISAYRSTITTTCQIGYGSSRSEMGDNSVTCSDRADSTDCASSELRIFDGRKKIGISVSCIKPPAIKQKTGRPTNKRHMSHLDGNIKKVKIADATLKVNSPGGRSGVQQSRFCSVCRSSQHDIRKCPYKDAGGCQHAQTNELSDPLRDL